MSEVRILSPYYLLTFNYNSPTLRSHKSKFSSKQNLFLLLQFKYFEEVLS